MSNEIKEILRYLRIENGHCSSELSYEETHILLDYITNLQHTEDLYNQLLKDYEELEQAYQELKDSKQWWTNRFNAVQRDYKDYKSRIEKADWWLREMLKQAKSDEAKAIINGTLDLLLNGRSDE